MGPQPSIHEHAATAIALLVDAESRPLSLWRDHPVFVLYRVIGQIFKLFYLL